MANIITYCRILCSISMMSFHMPSISFFLLYMICGLSDVLDGIIDLGAKSVIWRSFFWHI